MLHLVILTVCRTNEIRRARPEEFDLRHKIWTIPSERMKMGLPHRVPLCDTACDPREEGYADGQVWPPLFRAIKRALRFRIWRCSSCLMVWDIQRSRCTGSVRHFRTGRRSMVRYPEVLADKAIAHKTSSKARRAYQRGDMLEKAPKDDGPLVAVLRGDVCERRVNYAPEGESGKATFDSPSRGASACWPGHKYCLSVSGRRVSLQRPVQIGGGRVAWLETDVDASDCRPR